MSNFCTIEKQLIETIKEQVKEQIDKHFAEQITERLAEQITTNIQQNLDTRQETGEQQQPTYANTLKKYPPQKLTLIITPKETGVTTEHMKKRLNTIKHTEEEITGCYATKRGQLIIQCEDESKLESLKQKIEERSELTETMAVKEAGERKQKVIIFGVPATPTTSIRPKEDDENYENLQEYARDFIYPALQKQLRKPREEIKLRIHMNIKNRKGISHIAIELPFEDARRLTDKGTILIGFHTCTVQRFINVTRCHKCQTFGHIKERCPYEKIYCQVCAGHHYSGVYGHEVCKRPPQCINCKVLRGKETDAIKQGLLHTPPTVTSISHKASDKSCTVYRQWMEKIKIQLEDNSQNFSI